MENKLGREFLPEDITSDGSWDSVLNEMTKLGDILGAGNLKAGFVNTGSPVNYIILPGKRTKVLAMNRTCPCDNILELFSH